MYRKVFFATVIFLLVLVTFGKSSAQTGSNRRRQAVLTPKMVRPLLVPERMSKPLPDLPDTKMEPSKSGRSYCVIQNDDGTPYWYLADFDSGMGFALYMDPGLCGGDLYPFKITQVHFYLFDPGGYKWPVELQINIKDLVEGNKCSEPGNNLHSEFHTIPSDSAYPLIINLNLNTPCWVNQPFFLEIVYVTKPDSESPLPSLLMDSSVTSADTCNNWVLWINGIYSEWSDFWGPSYPGDAMIRAGGETPGECDSLWDNGCEGITDSIVWDFSWPPVSNATRYHLYVKHPNAVNLVIDNSTLTNPYFHYVCSACYIVESYRFGWRWKVRAEVGGVWTDWSEERCFDVEPLNTDCSIRSHPLHSGWQWISTNIDPNPCKIESLFTNCWDELDIVIACDGSFCIPGVGCWIDCWDVSEMYKTHMSNPCTIQVYGSKVPTATAIPLPAGWNCIAYFPDCPLEPQFALSSIWSKVNIVKNDVGEFCIPGIGCWIDCLEPNEGYKVHLSSADTLVYPTSCPPPFAKGNSFPGFAQTSHFNYLGNTGESYSIVVNSIELNGKLPEVGDEIGVFTPSGLCVGGGVWQGEILGIAAWQDDNRTEVVDGFQVAEQMIFKLWGKSENKEIELCANFEKGDARFGTDAYALVSLKGVSFQIPEKFELAQNYPNPFNPETEISFAVPTACEVQIRIYNVAGQLVKLYEGDYPAGIHSIIWDGTNTQGKDVSSGIYFYRMEAGSFVQQKKMVLMR